MRNLHTPAVPDLARVGGYTVDEAVNWLLQYYNREIVPWNYKTGIKCIKQAYRGYHNLEHLLLGCSKERIAQGRTSNQEIVRLGAKIAFGRSAQVFDLQRRQFPFGRDLRAGYRVPFFFVENKTVKLYFLQPRKSAGLTLDEICMVATIHKRFLLDTEFYGERVDVEYVDLSVNDSTGQRQVTQYSLESLPLWSEARLTDRLTVISEALERVKLSEQIKPRAYRPRRPDAEMPLFD